MACASVIFGKFRLLSATALAGSLFLCTYQAHAQSVVFDGDNGTYANGCAAVIVDIPGTCAARTHSVLAPYSTHAEDFSWDYSTGVLIGTNHSNAMGGGEASGSVIVTDGGTIDSGYVYIGYEDNTDGFASLDGTGSRWLSASASSIGHFGQGRLDVTGGALYQHGNIDYFHVGYGAGSNGILNVSGVDVTNVRSTVTTRNRMYFGIHGNAEVNIFDGGLLSAEYTSSLAEFAGSTSTMTVSGVHQASGLASTFRVLNNQYWLGYAGGTGVLNVLDGGRVEINVGLQISGNQSVVNVSGVHAATNTRSSIHSDIFQAGVSGRGSANISNGGLVEATSTVYVGRSGSAGGAATTSGLLTVGGVDAATGYRSTVHTGTLSIGTYGHGTLYVKAGGLIQVDSDIFMGNTLNSTALVNIDGANAEIIATGDAVLGDLGIASLTLTNQGRFSATNISLGVNADSAGYIHIGTGGQAGILEAHSITGGAGYNPSVNFNHIDDIDFSPEITGTLSVNKMGAGTTTLMGATTYNGLTEIMGGMLRGGLLMSLAQILITS